MPFLDNDYVFDVELGCGGTVTTYFGSAVGIYKHPIVLPKGYEWEIVSFSVVTNTTVATGSDCYTWGLYDSDGNAICTIGTGATGVPATTAQDTTPTATYKYIDTTDAEGYVYVSQTQSGNGKIYPGARGIVHAKAKRAA